MGLLTNQELEAAAGKHARAATVGADEWVRRVRLGESYPWRKTEWGKALLALEQTRKPPAPAPPKPQPPSASSIFSGRGMFITGNSQAASGHPCDWVAVQMDPEGDHRAPTGTGARLCFWQARPTQAVVDQAAHTGIPWIGQAESQPELDACLKMNTTGLEAKALVGNPTAWTQAGFDAANQRGFDLVLEWYFNAMPWQTQPDAHGYPRFRNVCFGIYDASSEHPGVGRQLPLSAYTDVWHGPYSCWTAEYMTPGDWQEFAK